MNRLRKKVSNLTLGTFFLCVIFFAISNARAETVSELQQKIDERNALIKDLEREITEYQKELETVGKEKQTLQNALKGLEVSKKKLGAELRLTENKITATKRSIEELAEDITEKKEAVIRNKEAVAEIIRKLEELDGEHLSESLLKRVSLSELWESIESERQLSGAIRSKIDELETLKIELEGKKTAEETARQKLITLKSELRDRQALVLYNEKEKEKLLKTTKNKESEFKKILTAKVASRDVFEKELLDYESQLKFELDPKSLPSASSGILRWPLDFVKITQQFGHTTFSRANPRIYNGTGHNGIDLKASVGTPIRSAGNGTVIGVGNTDSVCPGASYGKWVLISHGNGLATLYAHFSIIKVSEDQKVVSGEVVGYSGDTGYATGPHLHFTVYAEQAVKVVERKSRVCLGVYRMPVSSLKGYLNPLLYL